MIHETNDGTFVISSRTHIRQHVKFLKAPEIGSSNYYLWHPDLELGVWYIYEYSPSEGSTWRKRLA